jgi:hypothetical protein
VRARGCVDFETAATVARPFSRGRSPKKIADKKLTSLAEGKVNMRAAS